MTLVARNRIRAVDWHLHNWERWIGLAAAPNAEIHRADRLDQAGAPFPAAFQIDAGNLTWGNWVQVMGSGDTPVEPGNDDFDLHRLLVVAAERQQLYVIQIGFGASGAAALAAGTYTVLAYKPVSATAEEIPLNVMVTRQEATEKAWVRCVCPGQNTATLDFYLGLHEYPD